MSTFSLILLAVLIAAAAWGFHKGFVSQLGALVGLVVGVIACRLFGPAVVAALPVAPVEESLPRHYLQLWGVYAAIYIGAYLVVVVVSKLLKLIVEKLALGPVDSLAGAAVGLLKWAIPLSLLLNLGAILWPDAAWFDPADPIVSYVKAFAPWLLGQFSLPTT